MTRDGYSHNAATSATMPSGRRGRDRTACNECRRAKVRCTINRVPCARCERLRFTCEWDSPSQKQSTPQRASRSVNHGPDPQPTSSRSRNIVEAELVPSDRQRTPHENTTERTQLAQAIRTETSPSSPGIAPLQPQHNDAVSTLEQTFAINGMKLQAARAQQLFASFYTKYHPYMPILDLKRSPAECHKSSELLFWTVISIAVRDQHDGMQIINGLSSFFNNSIGSFAAGGDKSALTQLMNIQALLLLSLWPFLNVHWWTDRSWVLSNLALSSAIQIGLHQPSFETEYSFLQTPASVGLRRERLRTWGACVAITQNLAADFGFLSVLPFNNWALVAVCEGNSRVEVPDALSHYVTVQRGCYTASAALPDLSAPREDLTLTEEFTASIESAEKVFDGLEQPGMSLFNRMSLVASKLYIQCMYFNADVDLPSRQAGLIRAYASATQLIRLAISAPGSNVVVQFSPRTTTRMLNCAAMVMGHILHSSLQAHLPYEEGKLLFNTAALCISQQAVRFREQDTPIRFAEVLRILWEYASSKPGFLRSQPPTLRVKTRGGVGIIYDTYYLLRMKSRDPHNEKGYHLSATAQIDGPDQVEESFTPSVEISNLDLLDLDWLDEFGSAARTEF